MTLLTRSLILLICTFAPISQVAAQNKPVLLSVENTLKQTMRYGMDYERLWYWSNSISAERKAQVAKWSVVDCDIDYLRVAINSKYELTEGEYDLRAYTHRIIPMMQAMKKANPKIKFFASPRPLNEAVKKAAWQPYPQWITGSTGSGKRFKFDWKKCAEYLVRYIKLMDKYDFKISYLDVTNEWNHITPTHVRDIADHLKKELSSDQVPLIIAPSTWNFSQGESWLKKVNTKRRRDAIDIAASHNTDKTGTARDFVRRSHKILGPEKEIWNTELHGWKSTSKTNEVTSFSFMTEAIRAGFSGINGWLAIGTKNQGHSYILNENGKPRRNVKYFIFQKLTNTSHRGRVLDITQPKELKSTTALVKGKLLTVWAINTSSKNLPVEIDLSKHQIDSRTPITRTHWTTKLPVEGEATRIQNGGKKSILTSIPAGSTTCFEIPLRRSR